jgi:hypothetical protein
MLSPYQSILDKLTYTETLDDIWKIAVDFFNAEGFTHIIYVYCRGYQNTTADTILLTTMPTWWGEIYREKEYAEFDPFFTYCCTTYDTLKQALNTIMIMIF